MEAAEGCYSVLIRRGGMLHLLSGRIRKHEVKYQRILVEKDKRWGGGGSAHH
jgi:hypothetical protein